MAKVIVSNDTTPQIPQSTIDDDSINKTFEEQDEQTNTNDVGVRRSFLVSATKSKANMLQTFLS